MSENADQGRMERCAAIASKILANFEATKRSEYTLRAMESIGGLELRELRQRKFQLGVGDDLEVVSLDDVLTVFSILEQQGAAVRQLQGEPAGDYSVSMQVPGEFSDVEAVRILSQLRIETPFDSGDAVQMVLGKRPG